jgi:hypothetical protein
LSFADDHRARRTQNGVDFFRPRRGDVGSGLDEGTVRAIQYVEEPVSIRGDKRLKYVAPELEWR